MAKLKRFTGKVFGGNATAVGNDPNIAQFGSALAKTFIGTTDPVTIQALSAWGDGFISAVTPTAQFPALPEMTGAFKVLSHQICQIQQDGVSPWDSGTIYYTNSFCSKNGKLYISSIDENQGQDPEVNKNAWKEFSSGGQSAFSLFDHKFSDHLIKNLSWLLSTGQDNRKQDYPSMYEAIVKEQATPTTTGVSIKLSTESFTDFDYVLNTTNETFRLPLKVKLAGGGKIPVAGNGMTLGLNYGSVGNAGLGVHTSAGTMYGYIGSYGRPAGEAISGDLISGNNRNVGITIDGTKSGLEADLSKATNDGIYLYFYVGDTIQNADIVDVADIKATKADIDLGNIGQPARQLISKLGKPSNRFLELSLGASGSVYTAPSDGYFYARCKTNSTAQTYLTMYLGDKEDSSVFSTTCYETNETSMPLSAWLPVSKGQKIKVTYSTPRVTDSKVLKFYYAEGSN